MDTASRSVWIGLTLLLAAACDKPSTPSEPPATTEPTISAGTTTDLEELHAFAKLYGYVRFFHPSDEAAAADWDVVAVDGARRVVQGSTRAELLATLRDIFQPLAPTLLLFPSEAPPPAAETPRDAPVIAWQHAGYGLGGFGSEVYASGRTHRAREVFPIGPGWVQLSRSLPADQVRGKRVRLRGWGRVDGARRSVKAQLWMRVDLPEGGVEFFDGMHERAIHSTQWQEGTIESPPVGPNATQIVFGGRAEGPGAVFFDDFVLEVADPDASTWTPVALDNGDFESGGPLVGWELDAASYRVSRVSDAHSGAAALKLDRKIRTLERDVFDERPRLGETFERNLGAGLSCRVVLALPVTKSSPRTIAPTTLTPLPDASDPAVRVAAVIVAWNVLQHFYPYHDVIGGEGGEDWEQVLDLVLTDVLDDGGPEDLQLTLRRLVHRLQDGHGHVSGPIAPESTLPLRIVHVDGIYVVVAAPKDYPVLRGDEIVSIDGVPPAELFEQRASLKSGSPQWIDHVLLAQGQITAGRTGTHALVEIRRADASQVLELERKAPTIPPDEFERPYFEYLEPGVLYVDLVRIPQAELMKKMGEIARAQGVLMDVRGYPQSSETWLRHFLTKRDRAKWTHVPRIIRPDYDDVSFDALGWGMKPAAPHVAGKVAFITGPAALSYAESLMGFVEGYQLGAIVGSATGGANGNINKVAVPGGFAFTFTGGKVTRMDGRQHHLVGVEPTHPVERTLAGIRAGRDEELEVALNLVRPAR